VKTARNLFIIAALLVSVPAAVYANKRLYKAPLTPNCSGTKARGAAAITFTADAVDFTIQAANLVDREAKSVKVKHFGDNVVTICDVAGPSMLGGACPLAEYVCQTTPQGELCQWIVKFTTPLDQSKFVNTTGRQFLEWLDAGEITATVQSSCLEEIKGTFTRLFPD
jgi:hypothetical protein